MSAGMGTGDVIALIAVVLVVVGMVAGLAAWTGRQVSRAEDKASAGDRRLHERIDEVTAATMTRAEMVMHLAGLNKGIDEVKDDVRSLRDGMESLANAVIAGRGRETP